MCVPEFKFGPKGNKLGLQRKVDIVLGTLAIKRIISRYSNDTAMNVQQLHNVCEEAITSATETAPRRRKTKPPKLLEETCQLIHQTNRGEEDP